MDEQPADNAQENLSHISSHEAEHLDPQLKAFLNRFDVWRISADITLYVDGFVVSGTPLSTADYLRRLSDDFRVGFQIVADNAPTEKDRKNWQGVADSLAKSSEESAAELEYPDHSDQSEAAEKRRAEGYQAPREHVFLGNAVVLTPAGEKISCRYWRGRLRSVSGWHLGRPSGFEFGNS